MEEKKDYVEVDCDSHTCGAVGSEPMYPSANVGYHSHRHPATLTMSVSEEVKSQDKFGG